MLSDRATIVVQQDDLGLLEETNEAFESLGFFTGSLMAVGPWFDDFVRRVPKSGWNIGVHLTLTSDIPALAMQPLTSGTSLIDAHGFFPSSRPSVWSRADTQEVYGEFRAQIERISACGLAVAHLDSHMSVALRPDIFRILLELNYGLGGGAFIFTPPPSGVGLFNTYQTPVATYPDLLRLIDSFKGKKFTLIDSYRVPPKQKKRWYCETLLKLPPGKYRLIHHAAVPSQFVRNVDDAEVRISDYQCLRDPDVCDALTLMSTGPGP